MPPPPTQLPQSITELRPSKKGRDSVLNTTQEDQSNLTVREVHFIQSINICFSFKNNVFFSTSVLCELRSLLMFRVRFGSKFKRFSGSGSGTRQVKNALLKKEDNDEISCFNEL
jgi:hypothetical protein